MREKTRGWQLVDAVSVREIFEVKDSHSMGAGEYPPLAHKVQDLGIRSQAPPEQCPGTYL